MVNTQFHKKLICFSETYTFNLNINEKEEEESSYIIEDLACEALMHQYKKWFYMLLILSMNSFIACLEYSQHYKTLLLH